jgi:DNA-directed RNA polymerase subunit RPC12/RpoP
MSENVCPQCRTRTGIKDELAATMTDWVYWCFGCGDDYLVPLGDDE